VPDATGLEAFTAACDGLTAFLSKTSKKTLSAAN
jgi:hypothetical protein